MGNFAGVLERVRADINERERLEKQEARLNRDLIGAMEEYTELLEVQQVLSTISEDNANATLDFITGVLNKTLGEIFKGDSRRVTLERKLHAGKYPHINVKVTNSEGVSRDLVLQSGSGLRQVIAFLFTVCLIELRKGRKILLMDELLNGVHPRAKQVLGEIMLIFAENGYQFIMVEYGLNEIGKIYNVEKPHDEARVYSLDGRKYDNEIYLFTEGVEEPDAKAVRGMPEDED